MKGRKWHGQGEEWVNLKEGGEDLGPTSWVCRMATMPHYNHTSSGQHSAPMLPWCNRGAANTNPGPLHHPAPFSWADDVKSTLVTTYLAPSWVYPLPHLSPQHWNPFQSLQRHVRWGLVPPSTPMAIWSSNHAVAPARSPSPSTHPTSMASGLGM